MIRQRAIDATAALRWRTVVAALAVFIATLLLVMVLQEASLKQGWIYALLGLSVLLPYGVWLTVVLHYDRWTSRPHSLVLSALAWGSLFSFSVAVVLEQAFDVMDASLGVPDLDTMIVAPFWEEVAKGLFIVLLYAFARRHLRGPWDGLIYGALVGAGFGLAEDVAYLSTSFSEDGFSGLTGTYLAREFLAAHAHPLFTAVTGMAAGIATRRGLSLGKALPWILCGFLIAFILHAIFDSATVLTPAAAALVVAPAYGAILVIALRRLHRREIFENVKLESEDAIGDRPLPAGNLTNLGDIRSFMRR